LQALASLSSLFLLVSCGDGVSPPASTSNPCDLDVVSIPAVQGDGYYSPYDGSHVSIRGTVTLITAGHGFYIEEAGPGTPGKTSRALFVTDAALSQTLAPGQNLVISGRVEESGSARDKLTSLTEVSSHEVCSSTPDLPLTRAELPMSSREREALEGMRLAFGQPLLLSDVYNFHRGEVTLSLGSVPRVPTEIQNPGSAAVKQAAANRSRSLVAALPQADPEPIPVGSSFHEIIGVMGHNGKNQIFLLDSLQLNPGPVPTAVEPPADGSLRIVSLNLLNFFNGDGRGGSFPTERGAESHEEFLAQSERTRSAIALMQADLLAVQELENDGFGPYSAAQSLLNLLNRTGSGEWAFVAPEEGKVGTDVISVGLFYRQQALEAVGPGEVLDGPDFRGLSRHPLAQVFRDRVTSQSILVVVNHLKSKGSCPESGFGADRKDGQGCWNQARVDAIDAQLPWLDRLTAESDTPNVLVLGDMNAWRREDPIRQFIAGGFVDLVEQLSGLPQHSFLYFGQTGTLDYAFASPALAKFARTAQIWHINATWPRKVDPPKPWLRMSDHDPVIVDFDFSQAETSD
jgi:predicted extracellular nuclease